MSKNLETKLVPFMGTELMAAQDNDGQVWAAVRWLCDGIGMTRNQRDNQIEKIKANSTLSKGAGNLTLPTNGGLQSVLCLKLDYVPLWLAKINITPTMERETPELAERLIQYQLKAKDVLAAAFLPQYSAAEDYRAETRRLEADNKARSLALREQAAKDKRVNTILTGFIKAKTAPEKLALLAAYRAEGYGNPTLDAAEQAIIDGMNATPAVKASSVAQYDPNRFTELLHRLVEIGVRKNTFGVDYICIPTSEARSVAVGMNVRYDLFLKWAHDAEYTRGSADGKNVITVRLTDKAVKCVCLICSKLDEEVMA